MMNSLLVILLLIALANFVLSMYLLKYRKSAIMFYSFLFLLSIAIYTFGYAMELDSEGLPAKMAWLHFQYIGIAYLSTFWILLIEHYTNKRYLSRTYIKLFCYAFSTFILLAVFTNQYHLNFYQTVQIIHSGPIPVLKFSLGLWYWVFQVYLIICLILSIIFLIGFISKADEKFKVQAKIMLWGSFIPIVSYVIYLCGLSPYGIDLSPFSFSVVAVFYTIALYKYHFLDFIPPPIENVFRRISLGILIIDTKSRLTHFNKSMSDIFPFLNNYSLGETVQQLFKSYPEICSVIENKSNIIETEIHFKHQRQHLCITVSNYSDRKENLQGKIITFKDITMHKLKELALMDSITSKDKFFSIIAHDLKNSFSNIIGLSEIMVNDDLHINGKQFAQLINTSSRYTYNLLSDLLTWARSQRDQLVFDPQQIELWDFFHTIIQQETAIAANKSIELKSELSSPLPVKADYNMLHTIMRNLVSNAVKFTGNGGHVTLNAIKQANDVIVSVSDNGIGMTESEIKDLLRLEVRNNSQSDEKGTGLGLIICNEFVKKHGGNIWVQSKPDEGSTFFFSLPIN